MCDDLEKSNTGFSETARTILLFGDVCESSSIDLISGLMSLHSTDPMIDLTLMINSNGGSADDMFAIIDMMNLINPDVKTVVIGKAMSAGAFIAISGTKGKRFMTKNARLMLHTLNGGVSGNYHDIKTNVNEMKRLNEKIIDLVVANSNMDKDAVEELLQRDRYILPEEAMNLGLIDNIIEELY